MKKKQYKIEASTPESILIYGSSLPRNTARKNNWTWKKDDTTPQSRRHPTMTWTVLTSKLAVNPKTTSGRFSLIKDTTNQELVNTIIHKQQVPWLECQYNSHLSYKKETRKNKRFSKWAHWLQCKPPQQSKFLEINFTRRLTCRRKDVTTQATIM